MNVHGSSMEVALNKLEMDITLCENIQVPIYSGLIDWWTMIPLTYYSHPMEYIASGICFHLQFIK